MLLAENLMLLVLPDKGSPLLRGASLDIALAGAVVAELALSGHVRLGEEGETTVKEGKITVNAEASPLTDPLLARGMEFVAKSFWKSPASVLQTAQSEWRKAVRERLVRAEILSDVRRGVLGVSTHRWTVIDPRPRTELLDRLDQVLFNGAPADPEAATMAGMIYACGITVPVMQRGRHVEATPLRTAAKAYWQQSWPAQATYSALQAT
mgnify:CR=1 FL=1